MAQRVGEVVMNHLDLGRPGDRTEISTRLAAGPQPPRLGNHPVSELRSDAVNDVIG